MNPTLKRKFSTPRKEDLIQHKKIKQQIQDSYMFGAYAKEDTVTDPPKGSPVADNPAQSLRTMKQLGT
ncbi:hypothetical protein N7540_007911 [Penicillium herquei]|nr:hypothetical protein N7540_007911 [Penicillium herquei]